MQRVKVQFVQQHVTGVFLLLVPLRCKLGYFNLDENNPQGCTPCFCYQHSSVCDSADGFSVHAIKSDFSRGNTACKPHSGQR